MSDFFSEPKLPWHKKLIGIVWGLIMLAGVLGLFVAGLINLGKSFSFSDEPASTTNPPTLSPPQPTKP